MHARRRREERVWDSWCVHLDRSASEPGPPRTLLLYSPRRARYGVNSGLRTSLS